MVTAIAAVIILVGLGAFAVVKIAASRTAALAERDRALRVFTEGGRESLARGALSDAAFSLIQAASLGSTASGLDAMLGSVEHALIGVKRIGRGMTIVSEHAPLDSRYLAIAGRRGRVELYDKHTGALERYPSAWRAAPPLVASRTSTSVLARSSGPGMRIGRL